MDFSTIGFIISIIVAIIVIGFEGIRFIKQYSKDEKIKIIKSWLLSIIVNAEALYGGKTGKVKLSYVYGLFIEKFPKLTKLISFETFSALVDEVLKANKQFLEKEDVSISLVEEGK